MFVSVIIYIYIMAHNETKTKKKTEQHTCPYFRLNGSPPHFFTAANKINGGYEAQKEI